MAWKFEAGIPLSQQIVDRLRRDVISGVYPPGSLFPTVRQLAFSASVNPNTMQKALLMLEEEGLLVTLGTQGRIVTNDTEKIELSKKQCTEAEIGAMIKRAKELSLSRDELIKFIRKGWNENE
ncbi:MAG: GntR family transcriptional regulator [Clostridia bacterium]|nr:GntR family transcriptional regulator [Clostridia bacterium]